jgi:hypothetical protein
MLNPEKSEGITVRPRPISADKVAPNLPLLQNAVPRLSTPSRRGAAPFHENYPTTHPHKSRPRPFPPIWAGAAPSTQLIPSSKEDCE